MSVIDDIKDQIDIVDLVSETVKLRRTGKNYIGFCPFHANTKTPAFVVFPESGTWRCFGQCAEGGDAFGYVMKRDGCDFQQALEVLAKRAGVELTHQNVDAKAQSERERLFGMMAEAVDFYHNNLTQHPAGKRALEFLAKRGLTPETIEKFKLGYALPAWDTLTQHLLAKGYSRQDLAAGGLISEQRDDKGNIIPDGRYYDRFRNRTMIPILDSRGNPIGFGARILDPNDSPKFLNSPQSELFDKGKTLFALNDARRAIREKNQVVLVEGYMDVIVLHQAGFSNTVSPMGTALTDFQAKQLLRQTKHIVLALDADAAGDHGALRGIEVLRSVLKEEGGRDKLDADIRITRIPDGMDPDEVVLRDPNEWQQILDNAKPFVIHMMESAALGRDLTDGKTRAEIAEQILSLIREVPNAIERETYRQQLSRFLGVNESLLELTQQYAEPQSGRRAFPEKPSLRRRERKVVFDPKDNLHNKETAILHWLYRYYDTPGMLSGVDRMLRQYHLSPINPEDFEKTELHQIASCYFSALEQDEELDTRAYIEQHIPASVRADLEKLKAHKIEPRLDDEEMNEEVTRSLAYLRQEKCEFVRGELQMMSGVPDNETNIESMLDDILLQRRNLDRLLDRLNRVDLKKGKGF